MAIPVRTRFLGVRTSDPTLGFGSQQGAWWYRSDLDVYAYWDGAYVHYFGVADVAYRQRTGVTLYSNLAVGVTSGNLTANYIYVMPFVAVQRMRVDRIGCRVSGAGAPGAACRVGIYRDDGNRYPSSLVVDGGPVDCTGTGDLLASVDVWLEPGLYWMAFLCNDATITFEINEGARSLRLIGNVNAICWAVSYAYGALPAAYPGGAGVTNGPIPNYRIVSYG